MKCCKAECWYGYQMSTRWPSFPSLCTRATDPTVGMLSGGVPGCAGYTTHPLLTEQSTKNRARLSCHRYMYYTILFCKIWSNWAGRLNDFVCQNIFGKLQVVDHKSGVTLGQANIKVSNHFFNFEDNPIRSNSKVRYNLFMKVAFILSQPDKQFQRMDFPLEVSSTNIQTIYNPNLKLIIPKLTHKWKRSNGNKLRCQNSIRSSQGASNPEACVTISAKLHHFWICDLDQF